MRKNPFLVLVRKYGIIFLIIYENNPSNYLRKIFMEFLLQVLFDVNSYVDISEISDRITKIENTHKLLLVYTFIYMA